MLNVNIDDSQQSVFEWNFRARRAIIFFEGWEKCNAGLNKFKFEN